MAIPSFDQILNVLPPHLGDPRRPEQLSPYPCTFEAVVHRFSTSAPRKAILDGYSRLRDTLLAAGISGFQWIGGSFLEDVEAQENRDPHDIDVVTFAESPSDPVELRRIRQADPVLANRASTKKTYLVDHFLVPMGSKPKLLVDQSRYWYGLFSHRRDRVWKGMLVVDLSRSSSAVSSAAPTGGGT